MARRAARDLSRLGWIDYLLMGVGTCLAAYSAGMAVAQPQVGIYCMVMTAVGTTIGYLCRLLFSGSKVVKIDGVLYTGAVIAAVAWSSTLNRVLPEGGFPRDLIMAGYLTWMLILGSVFAWQDSTLLFQAIPSIALFGLIGCYDTYANVPLMFFGFLICLATLFARSQARERLRQAIDSGYFGSDLQSEDTAGLFERIKAGPWRWVAGPEWAMFSALAVVVVSFVGAPVIRETVKPLSGLVVIQPPRLTTQKPTPAMMSDESQGSVEVGHGPVHLGKDPVFEVTMPMDKVRYLRSLSFDVYTGHGWRADFGANNPNIDEASQPTAVALEEMKRFKEFSYEIKAIKPTRILPVPGIPVGFADGAFLRTRPDGSILIDPPTVITVAGKSWEPDTTVPVTEAQKNLPLSLANTTSLDNVPQTVIDFARKAAEGGKDDYDRAKRVEAAIGLQVKYNTEARATPTGRDPVEYFLFTQKEGYCEVFASSMVVTARSIGIPARYVMGYLPEGNLFDTQGHGVLRDADYHAWAELFFKDVGWVVFDATEFADAVPGNERGSDNEKGPWYKSDWFLGMVNVLIVLSVIGGVYFAYNALKRGKKKDQQRSEIERTYITFARALQRLTGIRRRPSQTLTEYLKEVRPFINGSTSDAESITNKFEVTLFSSKPIDLETVASLRTDVRNFQNMSKKERSAKK